MAEERELNDFQKALRDKILKENEEIKKQAGIVVEEEVDEDTQKDRYMTFYCCGEAYGIAITYVNEIIGIQSITEVPETPDYLKGLLNLRGKIIPVIDVRLRFRKEEIEYNDRTCVIVITVDTTTIGLIVDTIAEVVTIDDADVIPPPSTGAVSSSSRFIYGLGKVGNDVKLLVDPAKLIFDET